MKMPMDLGKSAKNNGPAPVGMSEGEDHVFYPSLFLEWEKDYDELPDSGTMTITFEVSRRTKDEKHGKYSVDIDVKKITSVKAGEKKSPSKEDHIDKLRKEVEDDSDY